VISLDHVLLAVSIFAVVLILAAEAKRGTRSAKLDSRMVILRVSLGIVFAFLGVIGSILPIMQGWIFFLLAALILFPQSRFAIKAIDKIEPKMPRVVRWLHRLGVGVHR
jgi:hypothetical protein